MLFWNQERVTLSQGIDICNKSTFYLSMPWINFQSPLRCRSPRNAIQFSSSYTTNASLGFAMIRQNVQVLSLGGYDVGRSCTERKMNEVMVVDEYGGRPQIQRKVTGLALQAL